MKNKKKTRKLLLLLVLVIAISVGFALLSTTLFINGTSTIKGNKWDIRWDSDSVAVTEGSVAAEDPEVTENDTKVSFEVELELPGDYYEFTIDAINAGTIDGMISDIVTTVKDGTGETATLPEYIHFSVTYADGVPIAKNHLLAKRVDAQTPTRETYKVRLEYDEEETTVPANDLTYTITYDVTYDQANANAVDRNASAINIISGTKGNLQPGDVVGIGETEDFYVISSNSEKTVLLAKYNLLVGGYYGEDNGYQVMTIPTDTPGYGLQSEDATGYTDDDSWQGFVIYSSSEYWMNENTLISPYNENDTIYYDENGTYSEYFKYVSDNSVAYPYVYDSNSTIYQYISGQNGYVSKLIEMGAPSTITGRLLSYEEAENTKSIKDNGISIIFDEHQSYWLGSVFDRNGVIEVYNRNGCKENEGAYYFSNSHNSNDAYLAGVRPVIEVYTKDIK